MQFSCFSLALVCFLFSYLFEDHHKYIISVFVENQERTLFSAIAYDMKKKTPLIGVFRMQLWVYHIADNVSTKQPPT